MITSALELTHLGSEGLGSEVKRRILMGSYALSAGHSDAYYKRAQDVQRIVEADLASKLRLHLRALLSPAAPTPRIPSK